MGLLRANSFYIKERKILMTVTKGLEGIVATTTSISSIIDGVLTYRGFHIDELAEKASYEEVVYLLWHGKLPTNEELRQLNDQFEASASVHDDIIHNLKSIPKDANAMAVLRTAVSSLAFYDDEADDMSKEANLQKAIKLQAKIPTIIAAFARIRQGKEPVKPLSGVSLAYNFLYMLTGKEPDQIAVEALNKALVLHADHELNASTFASRVTVATLSDLYSGVTTAIGTIKRPLHGGANGAVIGMLAESDSIENVDAYSNQKLVYTGIVM